LTPLENNEKSINNVESKKAKGDILEEKVERIFREKGYKTEMNYFLEGNSGEKYEIDVLAEYEGDLHHDKVVIECKHHKKPIGRDPIMKVSHILQDSECNKGIVVSPSGFTSGAREIATQKGIDLMDRSDLPEIESQSYENKKNSDSYFIQKRGKCKLDIPLIRRRFLISRLKNKQVSKGWEKLFAFKSPSSPTRKAFFRIFEKHGYPLSEHANITEEGVFEKEEWMIYDEKQIYYLSKEMGNPSIMDVFQCMGLSPEEPELVIKSEFKVTNRSGRTWKNTKLEGTLTHSKTNELAELSMNNKYSNEYTSDIYPDDSKNYDIFAYIPFHILIKYHEDLGLKIRLKENSKIIEERYFDISMSTKKLNKKFKILWNKFFKDVKEEREASKDKKEKGCFIATAVYGSPLSEEIDILRKFRDKVLLKSNLGRFATNTYYKLSPPIAAFISRHDFLRNMIGHLIVYPFTKLAKDFLYPKK